VKKYASEVVKQAQAWLGKKESDGSFKEIIDIYNSHPLARGYKMRFSDEWCAAFVSAVAIKLGYTDIIPTECSCTRMIANFVSLGEWEERDNIVPKPGWILFYDWKDNGVGDNKSNPSHVGIVEKVTLTHIYVIEGNYGEEVKRRKITINSKYIRGFGVPKYDAEPKAEKQPTAKPVQKAAFTVREWQEAAIADGYKFPVYGADGEWGAECESVAKKAVVKKRLFYTNKNLTKIVQKVVGVTADGLCGNATVAAIKAWQKKNGLTVDGCIGINGWKKMLKI
jgi:peptidoglycan hydrolase-like protein with peptidoglycan-binding domain